MRYYITDGLRTWMTTDAAVAQAQSEDHDARVTARNF